MCSKLYVMWHEIIGTCLNTKGYTYFNKVITDKIFAGQKSKGKYSDFITVLKNAPKFPLYKMCRSVTDTNHSIANGKFSFSHTLL